VLHLLEVAGPQAHEGRAVEGRIAAHPVVGVRSKGPAPAVQPLFVGAVAVLDEDRLGVPVLGLADNVFAPLEDQDRLAAGGQPLGQGGRRRRLNR